MTAGILTAPSSTNVFSDDSRYLSVYPDASSVKGLEGFDPLTRRRPVTVSAETNIENWFAGAADDDDWQTSQDVRLVDQLRETKKNHGAADRRENIRQVRPYFIAGLEKWECVVTGVYAASIGARLRQISPESDEELLEAEFDRNLVDSGDLDLLQVGAVFYFTSRTMVGSRGKPVRTASIAFQRLGAWHAEDIRQIEADTLALADSLRDAF